MRRAVQLCLAILLLASAPVEAQPQPAQRVIVERFRGPRGSAMRRALVRDLEDNGVFVIDESEVRDASRRLGIGRRPTDAEYVDLARELNAVAILEGRVRRRRRRWIGSVRVRNGADGVELGTESWGGRTAASLSGVGRSGHARLSDYLAQARSPAAVVAEPGETPWYQRREVEAPPPIEEPVEEAPPRAPSSRYEALRLGLGGGTLFRSMATRARVYSAQHGRVDCRTDPCRDTGTGEVVDPATATFDQSRSYQSGGIGHFEPGLYGELYPGAFGDQAFPYLGLLVSFSHSLGLKTNGFLEADPAIGVEVPTSQLELFVGARFRHLLGEGDGAPMLRLTAGYDYFTFDLGATELQTVERDTIIPPMEHGSLVIGAGIELVALPEWVFLTLDVAGRVGVSQGVTTRNVWGTDTGPSNGFSSAFELRVEVPDVVPGALFFAASVRYFFFVTDFRGQVGCAPGTDCSTYMDPWTDSRLWEVWPVSPPAPGGVPDLDDVVGGPMETVFDHYVRLQLQFGYVFR